MSDSSSRFTSASAPGRPWTKVTAVSASAAEPALLPFSSIRIPWASVSPTFVGECTTASLYSTSPALACRIAVRPPGSVNLIVNGSST